MKMQNSSYQSWYRAHPDTLSVKYENTELLSGFFDIRMQSLSCQSWIFVWVFGYEMQSFLGFLDCRAHLVNVGTLSQNFGYEDAEYLAKDGTLSGFLDMRMQSSSCPNFVWGFGYEDVEHSAKDGTL